ATIWLSAPRSSHGQNTAVGHGRGSPVAAITTAKKMIENGKPNRKRILVAPQVPSGPVNDRCIALRATWPSAAMIVKGIQSVATENMGNTDGKIPHRAGRSRSGQREPRHDRIAPDNKAVSSLRTQGLITTGFGSTQEGKTGKSRSMDAGLTLAL